MQKKYIAIVVVILIALGVFFWWRSAKAPSEDTYPADELASIERISANHFFKDGTHTLEGRITLPNPCYTLKSEATVAESMPEQVNVAFSAEKIGDICAQVLDEKIFSVSFKASKEAKISATLNGRKVTLDLIEQGSVKGDAIEKL